MTETFGWTEIEEIVLALDEAHPEVDPLTIRFVQLQKMVENLEEFEAQEGQKPNEQILEAIQAGWVQERKGAGGGDEEEDDERRYKPNEPFRS